MFSNAITVEAASTKSTKKWATAYMKIVKKMNKESKKQKSSPYFDNTYKYDLIYFNNDKTPELVVGVDEYWVFYQGLWGESPKGFAVFVPRAAGLCNGFFWRVY